MMRSTALLCMVVIYHALVKATIALDSEIEHGITKRSKMKFNPRFQQQEYLVSETDGTVEDLVCIVAGGDERVLSLFSARGLQERCFRFPCQQATEGVDFVAVNILEFILKPGETMCFDITLIDDNLITGRRFFLLALMDLRWGEIIETAAVTINDNDDPSLFTSSTRQVLEDDGTISVCVQGGTAPVTLKMLVLPDESSASISLDFLFSSSEQEINPGEVKCFDVVILDDAVNEGTEEIRFLVTQGNDTNATFLLNGRIGIIDNDVSPTFEKRFYQTREMDGFVDVCVVFRADPSINVNSTLITMDETAVNPSDYEYSEISFNISGGDKKCYEILINNDTLPEPMERLDLILVSSNSVTEPNRATVLIADDDVLDFSSGNRVFTVSEANVSLDICVSLLSGNSESVSYGLIETESITAEVNKDFLGISQFFILNEASEICFPFILLNDDVAEEVEQAKVTLQTISTMGFILNTVSANIILIDDEGQSCEVLTPPLNGRIVFVTMGNHPGSRTYYLCDRGFRLLESRFRDCRVNGTWSGMNPTCQEIFCPTLTDPVDGSVSFSSVSVDSTATYSCNTGFELVGVAPRTCFAGTGEWSGMEPTCQRIFCPDLVSPANGSVLLDDGRLIGAQASYLCQVNFTLVGNAVRSCQISGEWTGTDPTCQSDDEVMGMMELRLVNNSPVLSGNSVAVDYIVSGAVSQVECEVAGSTAVENVQGQSSHGSMEIRDLPFGFHTLHIRASNGRHEVMVEREFVLSEDPGYCGVHLVNDGLVVSGSSFSVQFKGVPTSELPYHCKLDNNLKFDCYELELTTFEDLPPGPHHLKVMHDRSRCPERRKLSVSFIVE